MRIGTRSKLLVLMLVLFPVLGLGFGSWVFYPPNNWYSDIAMFIDEITVDSITVNPDEDLGGCWCVSECEDDGTDCDTTADELCACVEDDMDAIASDKRVLFGRMGFDRYLSGATITAMIAGDYCVANTPGTAPIDGCDVATHADGDEVGTVFRDGVNVGWCAVECVDCEFTADSDKLVLQAQAVDFSGSSVIDIGSPFVLADATVGCSEDLGAETVLVNGATNQYLRSIGYYDDKSIYVGAKVLITGFNDEENNGVKTVTALLVGVMTVAETLVTDFSGQVNTTWALESCATSTADPFHRGGLWVIEGADDADFGSIQIYADPALSVDAAAADTPVANLTCEYF